MDKIKEKFDVLKECIESAEDRESDAKYKLREASERATKAEEDAESYKRRIALLTSEYYKTQEKIQEVSSKLTHLGDKIQRDQGTGKDLEGIELENDDHLNDMEYKSKEAIRRQDEKVAIYNDICRKLTKTEYDLSRAHERCEKAEAKNKESEINLKSATESVVKLEKKDGEAGEREAEQEEKIAFLQNILKEKLEKCEEFEREAGKLERTVEDLSTEVEQVKEKKKSVDDEKLEILRMGEEV